MLCLPSKEPYQISMLLFPNSIEGILVHPEGIISLFRTRQLSRSLSGAVQMLGSWAALWSFPEVCQSRAVGVSALEVNKGWKHSCCYTWACSTGVLGQQSITCFDSVRGENTVSHNVWSYFHIGAVVFDVALLEQSAIQPPHTSNTFRK